jgi:hypothetical protein
VIQPGSNSWSGAEFMPGMPTEWWWMREQGHIIAQPVYDEGSAALVNGSDIGVLSPAPAAAMVDRFFLPQGGRGVYRVIEHNPGDASFRMDSPYAGDDSAAVTFRLVQSDYALPANCIKILDPMITHNDSGRKIYGISMNDMTSSYPPSNMTLGTPERYAPVSESVVRFSHYTNRTERYDFFYLAEPPDLEDTPASVPLVPLNYRHTLADMACFFVLTDKEEERAVGIGVQAKAGIAAMITENKARWGSTGQMGQVMPRANQVPMWRRSESGRRVWWGS